MKCLSSLKWVLLLPPRTESQFVRQHLSFLAQRHNLGPPVVEVAPGRKFTAMLNAITGISLLILGVLPWVLFISACEDNTHPRGVIAILIFILMLPIASVMEAVVRLIIWLGPVNLYLLTSLKHMLHIFVRKSMYCCDYRRPSIRYYGDGTYFAWVGAKRLSSVRGAGAVAGDCRGYSVKCMLMRGQVVRDSYVSSLG
jgi:hypothetical protein